MCHSGFFFFFCLFFWVDFFLSFLLLAPLLVLAPFQRDTPLNGFWCASLTSSTRRPGSLQLCLDASICMVFGRTALGGHSTGVSEDVRAAELSYRHTFLQLRLMQEDDFLGMTPAELHVLIHSSCLSVNAVVGQPS